MIKNMSLGGVHFKILNDNESFMIFPDNKVIVLALNFLHIKLLYFDKMAFKMRGLQCHIVIYIRLYYKQ